MSFRFRKTIKIGGVRVTLGKSGISSISAKPTRSTNLTVGKTGVTGSVSWLGSGLSYVMKLFKW